MTLKSLINFKSVLLLLIFTTSILRATPQKDILDDFDFQIKDSTKTKMFYFSERKKANVLLASIQENEAKFDAGIPDSLLAVEKELQNKILLAERVSSEQTDSSVALQYKNLLFELNTQKDKLINHFERKHPRYFQFKYDYKIISIPEIRKQISSKTAVISYSFGADNLYIFVISNAVFEIKAIKLDDALLQQLKNHNKFIGRIEKMEFENNSLALYQKLIQPIAQFLTNKKHLIIIPEESMRNIPFETFLINQKSTTKPYTYLIEKYEISYAISATLAFKDTPKNRKQIFEGDFLGFAPIFADSLQNKQKLFVHRNAYQSDTLRFLQFSASEIEILSKLPKQKNKIIKTFLGKSATEEKFKAEINRFRWVHIATHSVFNPIQTKSSYIAFSQPDSLTYLQANDLSNDGLLFTEEVYGLRINTELLVLSSCKSGIGEVVGDDILSLLRAFIYAGAENIIYSVWDLNDKYTADLMKYFYTQQVNSPNQSFSASLRAAKLTMIEDPNSHFPYFWAGILLLGE